MENNKNPISDRDLRDGQEVFDRVEKRDESSPETAIVANKSRTYLFAGLVMTVVVLGALAFFVFYVQDMLMGQQQEEQRRASIAAQDKLLQEQKANEESKIRVETTNDLQNAKERITILENYITQIVGTLESSDIRVITSELEREKQERQALQGLLEEALEEIDSMKNLVQQTAAARAQDGTGGPVEEEKPKAPPSTSNTTMLDASGKWFAERDAERKRLEEEMKAKAEKDASLYDDRPGIPATSLVPAVLTTKIVSTMMLDKFFVQAQTTEDLEVGDGMVLKKGAVFYGKALPDFKSRRLGVEIEGLRVDHIQIPIKGVLLDKHGSPGLVSKYVDPFYRNLWMSMIPMAAEYFLTDKDDVNIEENTTDGGGSTTTKRTNARRDILHDSARTLSGQIAEHGKQESPVIIMNSGLPVIVQFTEKLPLDVLVESKSVKFGKTDLDNPFIVPSTEYRVPFAGGSSASWSAPNFTVYSENGSSGK